MYLLGETNVCLQEVGFCCCLLYFCHMLNNKKQQECLFRPSSSLDAPSGYSLIRGSGLSRILDVSQTFLSADLFTISNAFLAETLFTSKRDQTGGVNVSSSCV